MKRSHRLAASSTLILSFAGLAGAACAADAPADPSPAAPAASSEPIQEVVVTGQFRKEKIEKTPLSISYLSGAALESKGIDNVRDVAPTVPGLYLAPAPLTHSTASYFIRGVGESDSIANQTVVTYVDDVYTSRPIGGSFELNDVNNIQVLRGPQGTLYGRNSSAGAVVISTNLPTDQFSGFAEVGVGNYDADTIKLGLSGPLVAGKLDGSISYISRQREGLTNDITLHDKVGNVDSDGLRTKLNYTPVSWASFLFTVSVFHDNSEPTPLVSRLLPNLTPNTDPSNNYSNVQISNHTRLNSFSLRQTYDLSDTSKFEVITAEGDFKQPGLYDQDGSAAQISETYSDHRDRDWSQEFRYIYDGAKVHVSGGAFFLYDNFRSYRTNYSPAASSALLDANVDYYTPPVPVGVTPGHTSLQNSGEITKNAAVFGQVTYDLTQKLHLTLGDRFTTEEHSFVFQGNEQLNPAISSSPYIDQTYTISVPNHKWNDTTPKIDVDYDFTNSIAGYAYFAEGFKAGGFDGRAPNITDAAKPYNPEYDYTYEGGLKTQWFDNSLVANLAVFHNRIAGYQTTTTDVNLVSHRINLGEVTTEGFELETNWRPVHGLTWANNLSYLKTDIVSTGSEAAAVIASEVDGKQLPYAPNWQYYSSVNYVLPIHTDGTYRIGGDYIDRTSFFVDLPNTPASKGRGQRLFNLSASYAPAGKKWEVSLNVSNLFDKRYAQGGSVGNGITTADATTYNDPRLIFARIRYTY